MWSWITLRTVESAARRSGGSEARYAATVVGLAGMGVSVAADRADGNPCYRSVSFPGPEPRVQIAHHTVASFNYRLTDDSGELIDGSEGEPLTYIHGTQSIIPGLEQALEGKQGGDSLQVRLPPELAYGERDEDLVQEVPREALPAEAEIEVGVQFHAESDEGQ